MAPMYKQSMQRLKVNWIGLKLSQPLLLRILEGRKEEEEKRQWEEVERKESLYAQEEETTIEAWDVREATKAMKDMDIDYVAQMMSNTFSRGVMMHLILGNYMGLKPPPSLVKPTILTNYCIL